MCNVTMRLLVLHPTFSVKIRYNLVSYRPGRLVSLTELPETEEFTEKSSRSENTRDSFMTFDPKYAELSPHSLAK